MTRLSGAGPGSMDSLTYPGLAPGSVYSTLRPIPSPANSTLTITEAGPAAQLHLTPQLVAETISTALCTVSDEKPRRPKNDDSFCFA